MHVSSFLQVRLFPEIWNFPESLEEQVVMPDVVKNATMELNAEMCIVKWLWPDNIPLLHLIGFKVKIFYKQNFIFCYTCNIKFY